MIHKHSEKGTGLIIKAAMFATIAHDGQVRKYTGEPYVTHPIAVAKMVEEHTDDADIIAAALLHDVIEDTDATFEDLVHKFGGRVAFIVFQLTHKYTSEDYPHMNRAQRKAAERERLAKAGPEAKLIKRMDLEHNSVSIVEHDPHFAKLFLAEKAALMEVLCEQ